MEGGGDGEVRGVEKDSLDAPGFGGGPLRPGKKGIEFRGPR